MPADRGLAIEVVLNEHGWVPVVFKARIRIRAVARMGETVHTTFRVLGFSVGRTYDARMDCHVERAGETVHLATAAITHGYIQAGKLAVQALELGSDVVAAPRNRSCTSASAAPTAGWSRSDYAMPCTTCTI